MSETNGVTAFQAVASFAVPLTLHCSIRYAHFTTAGRRSYTR